MKVFLCISVLILADVNGLLDPSKISKLCSRSTIPFILRCHSWDASCLKYSAKRALPIVAAGIPSLNMRPLDPMYIENVEADKAGLNMNFRNTVIEGLRDCIVLDLKRTPTQMMLDLECSVVLKGDYSLKGNLFILPVEGQGKYNVKINNVLVKLVLDVGERESGGDRYWTVNSWQYTTKVLGDAKVRFRNLYNWNKELSDRIHNFANENWPEIVDALAPTLINAVVGRVVQETTKLFKQVPKRELAFD